jgi:hypothetical protein
MGVPAQAVVARTPAKVGRPRRKHPVQLKHVLLYEATLDQLRSAARANNRSMAKELQALFEQDPVEKALYVLARRAPEEGLAACARVIELAGDDGIDRAEVQREVALFITSPLGRAIQIAGADILDRKVVDGFAQAMGCTRFEAFTWWVELLKVVLPHVHQPYDAQPG